MTCRPSSTVHASILAGCSGGLQKAIWLLEQKWRSLSLYSHQAPPISASADPGILRSVLRIKAQRGSATRPRSLSAGLAVNFPLARLSSPVGPGSRPSRADPAEQTIRGRIAPDCTSQEAAPASRFCLQLPTSPIESWWKEGGCLDFPAPTLPQPLPGALPPGLRLPDDEEVPGPGFITACLRLLGFPQPRWPRWGGPAQDQAGLPSQVRCL